MSMLVHLSSTLSRRSTTQRCVSTVYSTTKTALHHHPSMRTTIPSHCFYSTNPEELSSNSNEEENVSSSSSNTIKNGRKTSPSRSDSNRSRSTSRTDWNRSNSSIGGNHDDYGGVNEMPEEVARLVHEYSQKVQTATSLQMLTRTGRGEMLHQKTHPDHPAATSRILLQVANFLQHELPIRLARRIRDLHQVPLLNAMPAVQLVKDVYLSSFLTLLPDRNGGGEDHHVIDTNVKEALFARKLELLYERHSTVLVTMARGAYELRSILRSRRPPPKSPLHDERPQDENDHDGIPFEHMEECHAFLDNFYMSRIGIRVLAGQYLALRNPPVDERYVGLICRRTSPYEAVEEAARDATYMCLQKYGSGGGVVGFEPPEVVVKGRLDLTLAYIPTQLHYILLELLKNAMRATVEHHYDRIVADGVSYSSSSSSLGKGGSLSPLSSGRNNVSSSSSLVGERPKFPPIEVIIADGRYNEDVVIKVSDEGGGIPRSNMKKIWSYLFTTADSSIQDGLVGGKRREDHSVEAPLAGLGYGLPISRSYARYFGGDVSIMSMEGYGTDAFVHLKRLGDGREPLPV